MNKLKKIFLVTVFSIVCMLISYIPASASIVMEGDLIMGKSYTNSSYETTVLQFTVDADDIGKYFHFKAEAEAQLSFFAVRGGDSGGYTRERRDSEMHLLVCWCQTTPNPEMEFRAYAAGTYTLVFESSLYQDPAYPWQQQFVAPQGMSVHYTLTKTTTSPARDAGRSIYIVKSSFPDTFEVEGQQINKSEFDFDGYQAACNEVFTKFSQFLGNDYTKYGSMVGVRYPADPQYPYGGDASNPMNVKFYTSIKNIKSPSVFTHELGHIFTQGYPFVYGFDSANNVEPAANYVRDWLADPAGGGGLTHEKFIHFQADMMRTLEDITNSTPWYVAVSRDGFMLLLKNISGGWAGIQSVFHSYSDNYDGNKCNTNGYPRAEEFYLKLVKSIPDENKRNAFYAQLHYWGCPFVPSVSYEDNDHDGFVSGIDPDDNNSLINPYSYEYIEDGIDNNLNGYIDEEVLKSAGETIRLCDDLNVYGDRGTRAERRIFLKAGESVGISVNSNGKPVRIAVFSGNMACPQGPDWWFTSKYPLVVQTGPEADPSIDTVKIQKTGVYTVDFSGFEKDGVKIGDEISYSITRIPPAPSPTDSGSDADPAHAKGEIIRKEGKHIALEFHEASWKVLEDPQAYLDALDRVFEAYAELVGGVPGHCRNGEKQRILEVDYYPGGWAVAGQPIRWESRYVADSLKQVNEGNLLFGILHEMGHNFDLDYRWVWHAEFFANFKMTYVAEKLELKQNLDIKELEKLFRDTSPWSAVKYDAEDDKPLKDWYAHSDAATHKFLLLKNEIGWEPFEKTFREYQTVLKEEVPVQAAAKLALFIHLLSKHSDKDLWDRFEKWGFPTLKPENYRRGQTAEAFAEAIAPLSGMDPQISVSTTQADGKLSMEAAFSLVRTYPHGLGTHANSTITYNLDGRYVTFEAVAGQGDSGSIAFEVKIDGATLWKSDIMRAGKIPGQGVRLDISKGKTMELLVADAGDGIGYDSAHWADAKLTDKQGGVVYLDDLEPTFAKQDYGQLRKGAAVGGQPLALRVADFPERKMEIRACLSGKAHKLKKISSKPGVYRLELTIPTAEKHLFLLEMRYEGVVQRQLYVGLNS